jgi:hypothetical protein
MAAKAEWAVPPWIVILPINVVLGSNQCLLCHRKRTSIRANGMSAKCQYRTWQPLHLFSLCGDPWGLPALGGCDNEALHDA